MFVSRLSLEEWMSLTVRRYMALLLVLFAGIGPYAAVSAQDDATQRRFDLIEQETAELRELPIKQEIDVTFKTPAQLRAELERDVDTDYPPEQSAKDERVLSAFGLIPQETDLSRLYVDLRSEQVAGYYNTETGEMVVIQSEDDGDVLSASQEITYAHEVAHALQDQNLSIDASIAALDEATDDESLASLALIEGDATVAQSEYLADRPGLLVRLTAELMTAEFSSDQLESAPPIIRESLLFPYDHGASFVSALREEGGWNRVDEAYASLPSSTEQILHPEKYLNDEQPVSVELREITSSLGGDWTEVDDGTFGEFQIDVLLGGQEQSAETAEAAAAGWGGDRYRIATNQDQTAILWSSIWESSTDAQEFADSLTVYDEQRFDAQRQAGADAGTVNLAGDGVFSRIIVEGEQVTYVQAPDEVTASLLA